MTELDQINFSQFFTNGGPSQPTIQYKVNHTCHASTGIVPKHAEPVSVKARNSKVKQMKDRLKALTQLRKLSEVQEDRKLKYGSLLAGMFDRQK
jgi:hypothetical protein